MTLEEFEDWLNNLPLQTLTDELKDDIIINVRAVTQDAADVTKLKINREVLDFIRNSKRK